MSNDELFTLTLIYWYAGFTDDAMMVYTRLNEGGYFNEQRAS